MDAGGRATQEQLPGCRGATEGLKIFASAVAFNKKTPTAGKIAVGVQWGLLDNPYSLRLSKRCFHQARVVWRTIIAKLLKNCEGCGGNGCTQCNSENIS